jgi:hypothetical protein
MTLGSKPLASAADEMGMSTTAYKELLDQGKQPVPFDEDDIVREANSMPPDTSYHVRDSVDPEIWYKLKITKRMQLGKKVYKHPNRRSSFKGFDKADKTAIYKNP